MHSDRRGSRPAARSVSEPLRRRDRGPDRRSTPRIRLIAALITLLACGLSARPAAAVIITLGDGTGNTTPPADDPGLAHVGVIGTLSGVYVGNGWVLTANHVGVAPITLGGTTYQPYAHPGVRLFTSTGVPADLRMFKIDGDPGLPMLPIASTAPGLNSSVVMYGHGLSRGAPVSWGGADGWITTAPATLRWGTNRIAGVNQTVLDTRSILTSFDASGPFVEADEAQSAPGDSGGAVFYKRSGTWELAGIMFANSKNAVEQPNNYILFGNQSLIADVAYYHDDIVAVIGQPACSDGIDEDGDGLTDHPDDPGCDSPTDDDERSPSLVCDNGVDDDGDGLTDWPADPGCSDGADASEHADGLVCDDGMDNEGDGLTDSLEDPDCGGDPLGTSEGPGPYVPLTSGLGTGVLAATIAWSGRRRAHPGARPQSSSSRTL